jgi:hypothetical protein
MSFKKFLGLNLAKHTKGHQLESWQAKDGTSNVTLVHYSSLTDLFPWKCEVEIVRGDIKLKIKVSSNSEKLVRSRMKKKLLDNLRESRFLMGDLLDFPLWR